MNGSFGKRALAALTALVLAFALSGCGPMSWTTAPATTAPSTAAFDTAQELLAIIGASEEKEFSRVSDWLGYWGFPAYSASALNLMELYYRNYYVGELPSTAEVARRLGETFAAYMELIALSDSEAVTDLVMECYLAAVEDKYAYYMNTETYADYLSDMQGDFVGIGVQVVYNSIDKTMEIVSVMKDTPAMRAGLAPGDFIRAVDGTSVDTLSYYQILDRIKGEAGTEVTVTVERNGASLSFTMARQRLIQTTAEGKMLDGSIGYIRITEFDGTTAAQFKAAYTELRGAGARAFVFDVRDNPGGALTAILEVLDYMVADTDRAGERVRLASYLYYDGRLEVDYASDGLSVPSDMPIAVLTSEHTASAGELFASALKDYARKGLLDVTLVGTVTYGKGTMQSLLELPEGRATTISIAYYNPPYSDNYEGDGVTPDILSVLSDEAALKSLYQLTLEEDTQLTDAIAVLRAAD